jgi:membrane-bound lytic murein transglycosylase B
MPRQKILLYSAIFLVNILSLNLYAKDIKRFKNIGLVENILFAKESLNNKPVKTPSLPSFWQKRRVKNQIIGILKKEKISKEVIQRAIKLMHYNDKIHYLRYKQPEFVLTLENYHERIDVKKKILNAKQYLKLHQNKLQYYLEGSNVDPEIVVALLAMETHFGKIVGKYNVIESLYTMAVETESSKARQSFFIKNILACVKLNMEGKFSLDTQGSWSGAVGNMQFMPTNLVAYGAVVDEKMDVYDDRVVYQSVKNYLEDLGWKKNAPFLTQVLVPEEFDVKKIGVFVKPKTVSEFKRLNLEPYGVGSNYFKNDDLQGDLIVPDFTVTDLNYSNFLNAFVVYENFHTIFDWNRSLLFGVSVGLIYEALKQK